MNPMLKYRGGKSREIPLFVKYLPTSFDHYLEPFLGGGAVFFYLEPTKAIINDINSRLMTFYSQVRDSYAEMRVQLDELQYRYETNHLNYKKLKTETPQARVPNDNEELYYKLRDLFNYPNGTYLDGVLYYFINKTAYSGMIRYNSTGEYNVPFGRYPNFNTRMVSQEHHNLLRRSELHNTDYNKILEMSNSNDFMFLDPPYDCVFNDYGNVAAMNGFDESQHRRLAADFRALSCKALMVIGKTALTEELYGEYLHDEYYKNYSVNIKNRFNNDKMHIIVKNY